MNDSLTMIQFALLTLGIVALKVFWLITEARRYKHRVNLAMLKTNTIEAVILVAQLLCGIYLPWPKTILNTFLMPLGLILYVSGVILALWGRLTMSRVWGIPGERYKNQNKLVKAGPFAFSRNPIYVGFTFIYVGYCLVLRSWLLVLRIPLFIYFYKSAIKEENDLAKEFGQDYIEYKNSVPRFLFI